MTQTLYRLTIRLDSFEGKTLLESVVEGPPPNIGERIRLTRAGTPDLPEASLAYRVKDKESVVVYRPGSYDVADGRAVMLVVEDLRG